MIIAVCADDALGLQFNHRRQSKDAALRQRLLELAGGKLRVSPATAKQFDPGDTVSAGEDYLTAAQEGDWCFCEDTAYLDSAEKIEKIVLFRWNRRYPADVYFTFPGQWRKVSTEDFPGTSHETITQEVYIP